MIGDKTDKLLKFLRSWFVFFVGSAQANTTSVAGIAALLFVTGCQAEQFGTFKRSLNTKTYGFAQIDDPTGLAPTKIVDRFEVRAGDCSGDTGWSDCANDRERSERSSSLINGEMWTHWSIYLPENYPIIFPVKVALGQFHQRNGHVVWMFQNGNGGYTVDNQTNGGTLETKKILSDSDMRGKWNDILVHVRWDSGDDGFFQVYVNGETSPRYSWFGRTKSPNKEVYFKYGVYRSFVSRRDGPEPTQVALFSDLKASRSCHKAASRFDCVAIENDFKLRLQQLESERAQARLFANPCNSAAYRAIMPSQCE